MENKHNKPQIIASRQEIYAGPLPHPQTLADYEKVYSGTAKIIVEAFQKQVDHRINMESGELKQSYVGQFFAFVVALVLLAVAVLAIINGYSAVATTICSVTLVSVIYAFVSKKKVKELKN